MGFLEMLKKKETALSPEDQMNSLLGEYHIAKDTLGKEQALVEKKGLAGDSNTYLVGGKDSKIYAEAYQKLESIRTEIIHLAESMKKDPSEFLIYLGDLRNSMEELAKVREEGNEFKEPKTNHTPEEEARYQAYVERQQAIAQKIYDLCQTNFEDFNRFLNAEELGAIGHVPSSAKAA